MRRLSTPLLLAALLACASCSKEEPPAPAEQSSEQQEQDAGNADDADTTTEDSAIEQVIQPWTGDLDGMIERRRVRILVTLSRTNYFIDRGRQLGLTYEAGLELEKRLNRTVAAGKPSVSVVFVPVSRDRLLDALIEGKGDIAAANLTVTPARLARVDFSAPLATGVTEVLVTGKDQPPLGAAEELSGRAVYVRRSSSYFDSLTALNERLAAAGKEPVDVREIDERLEDEDILEMVSVGLVPATVVDDHIVRFWVTVLDGLQVHESVKLREGGAIAWAIRRDSPQLAEQLGAFVQESRRGSHFGNVLMQKYLRDNRWVKNAAAEEDMARFRSVVDLFRTYGDRYDLPWLLVAAQAYQESGIDQSKRSSVGAVGVMQIKPSTAEGAPILITGVDKDVERNIEAGAKYLRFIVDQYFADEPMDRINKGLFAIASYNAGPARIARLRKEAATMGLDPNQWFGNVEVVAAKRIGRETVTYVSNIYKYYVTYNLALTQTAATRKATEKARTQARDDG